MRNHRDRLVHLWRAYVAWAALVVAVAVAGAAPALAANNLEVVALSTRPDTVSGGDVLVRIGVPPGAKLADVRVTLNGKSVADQFWPDPNNHALIGLVSGLQLGKNSIQASAKNASTGKLNLVSYPITGPIFSGPHEQPFFCETASFNIGNGVLLGAPIDADCSVVTRVDYRYRTTAGAFAILNDLKVLPANVATTTTSQGKTVNYVVRVETGTVNRGIYQFAILHDPTKDPAPDFLMQPAGWNKRLIFTYGGGCGGGWYAQGNTTGGVMVDQLLRQGYAVASSSLWSTRRTATTRPPSRRR